MLSQVDSDKIIFSPRLTHSHFLEASLAAKRQYFALKRNAQFVSRLVRRRTPKAARVVQREGYVAEFDSRTDSRTMISSHPIYPKEIGVAEAR
jgi:hypothetical protein